MTNNSHAMSFRDIHVTSVTTVRFRCDRAPDMENQFLNCMHEVMNSHTDSAERQSVDLHMGFELPVDENERMNTCKFTCYVVVRSPQRLGHWIRKIMLFQGGLERGMWSYLRSIPQFETSDGPPHMSSYINWDFTTRLPYDGPDYNLKDWLLWQILKETLKWFEKTRVWGRHGDTGMLCCYLRQSWTDNIICLYVKDGEHLKNRRISTNICLTMPSVLTLKINSNAWCGDRWVELLQNEEHVMELLVALHSTRKELENLKHLTSDMLTTILHLLNPDPCQAPTLQELQM